MLEAFNTHHLTGCKMNCRRLIDIKKVSMYLNWKELIVKCSIFDLKLPKSSNFTISTLETSKNKQIQSKRKPNYFLIRGQNHSNIQFLKECLYKLGFTILFYREKAMNFLVGQRSCVPPLFTGYRRKKT